VGVTSTPHVTEEHVMAIARRFKITHDEVFPHGAYLITEVGPVFDFERSTKDTKVNRPGFCGGSQARKDEGHGGTEEVQRRAA
jgi:hypothetical protein